ncbi:TRAP-type C4-dicarboxylate transport system permease small subunit [Amorphus suaedae]
MTRTETPDAPGAVEAALGLVSRAFAVVAGVTVLLMMLHVTTDVLTKYLLNMPIVGTLEIVSHYYMVAAIFLPLAAVERRRGHLFVELFTAKLAPRAILGLDAMGCLLGVIFAGSITWMSTIEALRRTRSGEIIDAVYYTIPIWPTRWLVPLGAGLLALMWLLHGVIYLRRIGERNPEVPAAAQEEF